MQNKKDEAYSFHSLVCVKSTSIYRKLFNGFLSDLFTSNILPSCSVINYWISHLFIC
jgi:hypothetical protein